MLIEALRDLNQRYAEHLAGFLADHASPAAERLMSVVDAELHPDIFNVRDMSLRFAFRGDRKSGHQSTPVVAPSGDGDVALAIASSP